MTEPHETNEFRHSATYTVAVTFTVAGGARPETAHRRAIKTAERITAAAARLADVVDAQAVVGVPGTDGGLVAQRVVHFPGANSGRGTSGEPDKLSRYIDPEYDRAIASIEEANDRYQRDGQTDRRRRRAVGCGNADRTRLSHLIPRESCACVYCYPDRYLDLLTDPTATAAWTPRCICGEFVATPGARCSAHRTTEIVLLDDDDDALRRIRDRTQTQ